MRRPRILLVDDESALTATLSKLLERRGYHTARECDGQAALRALEEDSFDVVVLDIVMPVMDGITTLKKIKHRHPMLEVILLTGAASVETALQGVSHGAFDYTTKPIQINDLEERIGQAFKRRLMRFQGDLKFS